MPSDEKPTTGLVAVRDAREQAIARLSDAFAHDFIEVDEFERRLALAHRADSGSEIDRLVAALTAPASPSAVIVPATAQPILEGARGMERESDSMLAVFGGVERRGTWTLPRRLRARAIFGGIVLDFREALLLPGVTEVHVVAIMGGVQLIVPPTLSVEVSGAAVMGGFGHVERIPVRLDPDRPLLRVRGLAIMGGVSVETRLPGESEAAAHGHRALVGRRKRLHLPEKTGR